MEGLTMNISQMVDEIVSKGSCPVEKEHFNEVASKLNELEVGWYSVTRVGNCYIVNRK